MIQSAVEDRPNETAEVVQKDEVVKGYEYSKGKYVIIEPSELEDLRVPSKHVIAVNQFIDKGELDPEYVEKPYFVTPEDDAQTEAFAVVREALRKTGKIAIGKVAFAGREHIVAVAPSEPRGMIAYTLRYHSEMRDRKEYFRDIKDVVINEDSLDLAEALIKKRSSKFDITKFEDGYAVAVKELVEAKIKNLPIPQDEVPAKSSRNVINLMDALRKSVDVDKPRGQKKLVRSEKAQGIGLVRPMKSEVKRKSA